VRRSLWRVEVNLEPVTENAIVEPEVDGRFVMMQLSSNSQAGQIATLRRCQVRCTSLACASTWLSRETRRENRQDAPFSLNASLDRSRVSQPATVPSRAVVNAAVLPSPAPATKLVIPFCELFSVASGCKLGEKTRRLSSEPENR
jgi:hypothetical protein